jgi:16S rRNA (guanine1516-N2)-methyltransferase
VVVGRGLASHPLSRILQNVDGPVIDATAGLGSDAGVAAARGKNVLLIERNDIVHALLQDALKRAVGEEKAIAERMKIVHADACQLLRDLPEPWSNPGAVLLDPMFPPRRRASALPPKPMQRVRELIGHDDSDAIEALLSAAQASGARRIVLKRPPETRINTSDLGAATFSIETKLLRWDVWERG